jgi:hypothetical protein
MSFAASIHLATVSRLFTTRVAFTRDHRTLSLFAFNTMHLTLLPHSNNVSPVQIGRRLPCSSGSHFTSHQHSTNSTNISKAWRFASTIGTRSISTNNKTAQHIVSTSATSAMAPTTPTRQTQPSSTDSSPEGNATSSSTPATTPPSTLNFELILAKHNLTKDDLKKIHLFLIEITMDGGQVILDAELALKTAVEHKNNSADVVTEFDKKIKDMVEKRVRDTYPSFGFLGEESFKHGTKFADTPTAICDPIDGTLNFNKGVPNCACYFSCTDP